MQCLLPYRYILEEMGTTMRQIKGRVYTKEFRFDAGTVTIDGDRIVSVELCGEAELSEKQREQYILPGLIDIHLHGCAGHDFCDGTADSIRAIASYELSHGITSICPATMTFAEEKLTDICEACADAVETEMLTQSIPLGDVLKGIYLEGPFISSEKTGAQNPAYIRKPDLEMLIRLQRAAKGLIRIAAIAPETEGALECIRGGRENFRFSIAHTCADYETAKRAIEAGACHVTHLFNAMPPFAHREPGVVGVAAESECVMVELICDGHHVHPGMVRSTFRLFGAERIVLISDSMMATGMEDGEYALGGQPVWMKGGLATLADGTLAGSAVTLFDCMKAAIRMGVPREDAVMAATYNPAAAIGIEGDCGSLRAGSRADILVTDRDFCLMEVIKSGITAMNQ